MLPPDFFETYPLYRKLHYPRIGSWDTRGVQNLFSSIQTECGMCKQQRTFLYQQHSIAGACDAWNENTPNQGAPTCSKVFKIDYVCAGCKRYIRVYYVMFEMDHVFKVGQFPPWCIEPPATVKKTIGSHLKHYKCGLANESIGYGIGAYAYYRRVIEDTIGSLLEQIAVVIPEGEKAEYQQALAKAKAEHVAEKKIQLVKHLLPESLKIEGINPLDVVYTGLSEGLHDKSDEECLKIADALRKAMTHLIEEIERARLRKVEFTDSMRKVLSRNWGNQRNNATGTA